jgi:hypothetical protein
MVAKVDEQNATMVTDAVDPAGQADGRADIGLLQGGTGVAAVTVHGQVSRYVTVERAPSRQARDR